MPRALVVQLEYRIMGQFLPEAVGSAPCLLVDRDPVRSNADEPALLPPLEASVPPSAD